MVKNKKVLIFFSDPLRTRHGGPYTYLYHLKSGLASVKEIFFLEDIITLPHTSEQNKNASSNFLFQTAKNRLPEKIVNTLRILRYMYRLKQRFRRLEIKIASIDLNAFDIIHFHQATDIWGFEKVLSNYRGTILLTSHSPLPLHLEWLEENFRINKIALFNWGYQMVERVDKVALLLSHALVVPTPRSLEAYKQWENFLALTLHKPEHYVLTGTTPLQKPYGDSVRKRYAIPRHAFLICFNGRHSRSKGFDLLAVAARKLLAQHNDLYFLITGIQTPLQGLNHPRWIETGWVNDPAAIVDASNVVVVPNRETFFDLNVLEVLSVGKFLLLSNTGGNRFFHNVSNNEGIAFFEYSEDDFCRALAECYAKRHSLAEKGKHNVELFEEMFTVQAFAKRYLKLYASL